MVFAPPPSRYTRECIDSRHASDTYVLASRNCVQGIFAFSFGKRNGMNLRRSSDCIVIQPSEMIVVRFALIMTFITLPSKELNCALIMSKPPPYCVVTTMC